jgi:hypothetical protein
MIGDDTRHQPRGIEFWQQGGTLFAILIHYPAMRETAHSGKIINI